MTIQSEDFVLEMYQDMLSAWQGKIKTRDEKRREEAQKTACSKPFEKGRSPQVLGTVLAKMLTARGWDKEIAEVNVCANWAHIAGVNTARKSKILHLQGGVLTVQAQTQAWTVELRRLKKHILERIKKCYPAAEVTDVQILPPTTVSWKHGPYSVPGRGPRDTYDLR